MKGLSRTAKASITGMALVSVLVFGVIVDFGVNAGVVHQGITVSGLDVGGLTLEETQRALNDHRSRMREDEVCFSVSGFEDCFLPEEVGWFPRGSDVGAIAQKAFDIGRSGGPLVALGDRLRAWSGDIRLSLPHSARPSKVTNLIDGWEQVLLESDIRLDRARTRARIKEALATWPRRKVPIPIL
jgi:hypothetical protein